jgi:hypothetical protein
LEGERGFRKICATFPFFEGPRDVFEGLGKKKGNGIKKGDVLE